MADIDVILGTGQRRSSNYYYNAGTGVMDTSNSFNTTTPYLNATGEPGHADMAHYLAHEKEVTADNYIDIITRDTPLFLNEGNFLRFETTADFTHNYNLTLVVTLSYIDHYG